MRSAEVNKYWKDLYSVGKYSTYLHSMELIDCMGYTGTVLFHEGLTVFSGLNGVGKSTIISCIKQSIGLSDDSIVTGEKGHGVNYATLHHNGEIRKISPVSSAVNQGFEESKLVYIDCNQSIELLKQWSEQRNIDEYLDQFEINIFSEIQLREVSWLIGKDYAECKTIETDEETNYVSVFFEVIQRERKYSSVDMGLGEHFLMYIYYVLRNIKNNSILIIEEPESFISVLSQQRLMDYLAKTGSSKRTSIIITTHSPYILTRVKKDSIRIVGNVFGKMIINSPNNAQEAKKHLEFFCQYPNVKNATIFVEDYVARMFLDTLLADEAPYIRNNVDIVSVEGCEGITNRLSFDDSKYMSHKLIGVYDEDMKGRLISEKIKWPYLFMPISGCVEKEIASFIEIEAHANEICNYIRVNSEKLYISLSKCMGEDHHDWFLDMCKDLEVEPNDFIRAFYSVWKYKNNDNIAEFMKNIDMYVNQIPHYDSNIQLFRDI